MRYLILFFTITCVALTANSNLYAQDHVNVEKLGEINLSWENASDVYVQDDYAFVATGQTGLQIVDISDPEQLEVVGIFNDNYRDVYSVCVSGDYAYINFVIDYYGIIRERGLVILDISEPSSPEEVGACETPRRARKITVVGDCAYLAAQDRLIIIDVSNPANPSEMGFYETSRVYDVFVRDNYAYIARDIGSLLIIDISNPEEPDSVSSLETPGHPQGVCVEGDYAYIADGPIGGLQAIDVSNPEEPFEAGAIDSLDGRDVFVSDNFAYVISEDNLLYIVDITDPDTLDVVGVCESGNSAVFVIGNSAYVARSRFNNQSLGALQVIDVSEPENPVEIGVYGYDRIRSIFVEEDFTFVACGGSGLLVLDSSDPEDYEIVSELHLESRANSVVVEGAYAYVSCRSYEDGGSLRIIDISDPENPESVENYDTGTRAINVHIVDNLAYLACDVSRESGELHIIDISDPANPDSIGGFDLEWMRGGNVSDIFVEDTLAFLTFSSTYIENTHGGFLVLDVTDPTEPDSLDCGGWVGSGGGITVSDEIAYIVGSDCFGVRLFDVSDPRNIEEFGQEFFENYIYGGAVKVMGDYAYVSCVGGVGGYGLHVFDVSDPEDLHEAGYYTTPLWFRDVFLSGELTYLASDYDVQAYRFLGGGYLTVSSDELDFEYMTIERSEELILTITNTGNEELAVAEVSVENNSFSADFRGEVVIDPDESYDLTVIFTPQEQGEIETTLTITPDDPDDSDVTISLTGSGIRGYYIDTPGSAKDICVSGDYAYVADWGEGLRVIDVSDKDNLVEVGFIDTTGFSRDVSISDTIAYLANGSGGLFLIDISDPENPETVGCSPNRANDVFISGQYAYTISDSSRVYLLRIMDISDPSNPEGVSTIQIPSQLGLSGVYVSGIYCYLTTHRNGLFVTDVSNPDDPETISNCATPGQANDVFVSGEFAYIAGGDSGLYIFDVSNPREPEFIETFQAPEFVRDVYVVGDIAYIVMDHCMQVIDVSDPANPELFDSYWMPGHGYGVHVSGDYAYVADHTTGLIMLGLSDEWDVDMEMQVTIPEEFYLSPTYPNPFNASTILTYGLPVKTHVSLQLFDINGREVGTLVEGKKQAGVHRTILNAVNMPSGLYFVHLSASGHMFTRKVMLIR